MSSNQMFLSYDSNNKKLQIPVLPEKVSVSYSNKDDSVYVYGVGDVTIKKHPGAVTVKFDSFFPKTECQGSVASPTSPKECAEFMKKVMELDGCAKFTYTGGAHPISMYCTVSYEEYEQGGDPGTIYYSLALKEYKVVTVRQVTVIRETQKASVTQTESRATTQTTSQTYTVVSGDCLWNIAKRFYGSGAQYTKIYEANKSIIGSNPNRIYPGWVLTIP